jgi:mannose-1-phosphate guanylyltransferase
VANRNSKDSLVYNFTDKMIATVGLEGMLVVATDDVVMVAPKEAVPEIKKMLKDFKGTKNEKYT